jgi:AhpD family alkylhydroperoxidase
MDIEKFNVERNKLNNLMSTTDSFFEAFGRLDDGVYSKGMIPKKYKELTGLAISILSRCEECILYHVQGALNAGASKEEIIEAIKIGVIGGGSITYPSARFAFNALQELGIL